MKKHGKIVYHFKLARASDLCKHLEGVGNKQQEIIRLLSVAFDLEKSGKTLPPPPVEPEKPLPHVPRKLPSVSGVRGFAKFVEHEPKMQSNCPFHRYHRDLGKNFCVRKGDFPNYKIDSKPSYSSTYLKGHHVDAEACKRCQREFEENREQARKRQRDRSTGYRSHGQRKVTYPDDHVFSWRG